ncbi:LPS export ABC transporter permease LptF [Paramagnetospirillum kuznetsovii]|uniref:LPS export ABC transporter permease LptF n=1 Tax=Paramagnetospirillum kuznetsovii TaxID=2053833 RepID=A0A364NU89_9PROT|nr:LPS export ABC transporter permease LptF [Paramagnetospirillum kuznetsovii]
MLRQMVVGMLFVSIALTCVLWLTQSLRFVEMIVNKGLSIGSFLKLTMLLMPGFLVVIIPISLFAVVLFTYNKLIADRELVVLRAAGLSHLALARPAMVLGLVTTALGYLLSCWIIPVTVRDFHEMHWTIRNDISNVLLQEGMFNKFGDGLTIYVRSRSPAGELLGLLVHDKRSPNRAVTLMAEKGALVYTETGPRVLMINGNRQEVTPGTGKLSLLYFDSYTVDFATATGAKRDRFRDARERGTMELLSISEGDVGPQEYRRFKVEMHSRLTAPLYNLGFALLAACILLTAGFDRRGQLAQVLISTGLMVGVQAAALGISNVATGNLTLAPAIYLNAVIPIGFGLWVLTSPPWQRRRAPATVGDSA